MENQQNQNLNQIPQQPVSQPVNNSENSSFLHSKWLKIGAVIIVTLILLGGTYLLGTKNSKLSPSLTPTVSRPTPTIDSTINWQTYSNKQYGISFKYPADMKTSVTNDVEAQFLLSVKNSSEEYSLDISPTEGYSTYPLGKQSSGTEVIGSFTWNIVPASKYCDAGQCFDTPIYYQISSNGFRYDFSPISPKTPTDAFKKILSTVRLSQPDKANATYSDTSSWKVYDKQSIYFRYPNDWNLSNNPDNRGVELDYVANGVNGKYDVIHLVETGGEVQKNNFTVNGMSGDRESYPAGYNGQSTAEESFSTSHKNGVYNIYMFYDLPTFLKDYNTLLSTFKFTQ